MLLLLSGNLASMTRIVWGPFTASRGKLDAVCLNADVDPLPAVNGRTNEDAEMNRISNWIVLDKRSSI